MKVSIITVVYNNANSIRYAIESVLSQTYKNIEYIIIDGKSNDGTVEIINSFDKKITKFISEKDNGLYDAMNKGLRLASGDIVGILNSDDIYTDNQVITKIVHAFEQKKVDAVYADLVFYHPNNPKKIVRYYNSKAFKIKDFSSGMMPAHPTFFVKKKCYDSYGYFDTSFQISADFDLLVRFLYIAKISTFHLPEVIVKMSTGGLSTRSFRSNLLINREILKSCKKNGIKTNLLKIYSKYFTKVFQYFARPKAMI